MRIPSAANRRFERSEIDGLGKEMRTMIERISEFSRVSHSNRLAGCLSPWSQLSLLAMLLLLIAGPTSKADEVSVGNEPARWGDARVLHSGIRYQVVALQEPRPLVIHAAQIDLWNPDLRLRTTARRDLWVEGEKETDRQTTRDYLRSLRSNARPALLGFNADAFSPWPVPYNESTPTDLLGLAISDSVLVSRGSGTPSVIGSKVEPAQLRIVNRDDPLPIDDIEWAFSGFGLCLDQGQALPSGDDLHPRTGVGLSRDARFLIVVVIDGRQPRSHGATTQELGHWLAQFGAHQGINLDGGGSSTLAWWNPERRQGGIDLLNRPVGNSIRAEQLPEFLFFPTERANGNNVAVEQVIEPTTHHPTLISFLDDRDLIETTGMKRVFHQWQPEPVPIIAPQDPRVEQERAWGNVIREPDGRLRLWYCTERLGENGAGSDEIARAEVWGRQDDFEYKPRSSADPTETQTVLGKYAESWDGVHWHQPKLGIVDFQGSSQNNIVLDGSGAARQFNRLLTRFSGFSVLRDESEANPERRYKMLAYWDSVHGFDNQQTHGTLDRSPELIEQCKQTQGFYLTHSADGLNWNQPLERVSGLPSHLGVSSAVMRDVRNGQWIAATRSPETPLGQLSVSDDLIEWRDSIEFFPKDSTSADPQSLQGFTPFNYGKLDLAFASRSNEDLDSLAMHVAICDERGQWQWLNAAHPCFPQGEPSSYFASGATPLHNEPLLMGDELFLYFNAFSLDEDHPCELGKRSIGLARLRRDGFVSLNVDSDDHTGRIVTRLIEVTGNHLWVNVKPAELVEQPLQEGLDVATAPAPLLRVGLLDEAGNPIAGFESFNCLPVDQDAVRAPIRWHDHLSLASLKGRTISIVLELQGDISVFSLGIE